MIPPLSNSVPHPKKEARPDSVCERRADCDDVANSVARAGARAGIRIGSVGGVGFLRIQREREMLRCTVLTFISSRILCYYEKSHGGLLYV